MGDISVNALSNEHGFGARIKGITWATLEDESVRQRLRAVFEERGFIVFEDVEQSGDMQFALSAVFGPPQEYAIKSSAYEDNKNKGLITFAAGEDEATIVEFGGRQVAAFTPWHFDACYAQKLNRAGVLRVITQPPEDGMTGFADGVQIYNALSPEWQAKAAQVDVVYWQYNMWDRQRFGLPEDYRMVRLAPIAANLIEESRDIPRAVHPAVWTRPNGDKVLHVSPWQADGIAGMKGPQGDALLEDLIQEMYRAMKPYWHRWRQTDMLIWDNWRFVHSAGGYDPKYARYAQRTTIKGDYGLGWYEQDWHGRAGAGSQSKSE